jgi:hypothetical protein
MDILLARFRQNQRLGFDLLPFGFPHFGIGGTFAVIGFFLRVLRLGHCSLFSLKSCHYTLNE